MKEYGLILRFREWKYFNFLWWYGWRKGIYPDGEARYHILDLGAIAIGWRSPI